MITGTFRRPVRSSLARSAALYGTGTAGTLAAYGAVFAGTLIAGIGYARWDERFRLVVRRGIWPFTKGTTFSGPLKRAIDQGVRDGSIQLVRSRGIASVPRRAVRP